MPQPNEGESRLWSAAAARTSEGRSMAAIPRNASGSSSKDSSTGGSWAGRQDDLGPQRPRIK
jgi:hypothetical protein